MRTPRPRAVVGWMTFPAGCQVPQKSAGKANRGGAPGLVRRRGKKGAFRAYGPRIVAGTPESRATRRSSRCHPAGHTERPGRLPLPPSGRDKQVEASHHRGHTHERSAIDVEFKESCGEVVPTRCVSILVDSRPKALLPSMFCTPAADHGTWVTWLLKDTCELTPVSSPVSSAGSF